MKRYAQMGHGVSQLVSNWIIVIIIYIYIGL